MGISEDISKSIASGIYKWFSKISIAWNFSRNFRKISQRNEEIADGIPQSMYKEISERLTERMPERTAEENLVPLNLRKEIWEKWPKKL